MPFSKEGSAKPPVSGKHFGRKQGDAPQQQPQQQQKEPQASKPPEGRGHRLSDIDYANVAAATPPVPAVEADAKVVERRKGARAADRRVNAYNGGDRRKAGNGGDRRAERAAQGAQTGRRGGEAAVDRPKSMTDFAYKGVNVFSPRIKAYEETLWKTIMESADISRLARLDNRAARVEISQMVDEIAKHHQFSVSPIELEYLAKFVIDEMLGLGPLEDLLHREDIDEIMVNGPNKVYIEVRGVIEKSSITFRNEKHLLSICQRIVNRVGRHVDESSPICDARLPDGSRVNIILPPLALDGTLLTIRKFSQQKMSLERMMQLGSMDPFCAELIRMIAICRVNILVAGGTGSGKTTMLNCLTRYISPRERIVTCEDAAELQLQQPHVLRLETRPAGIEGTGAVTMRDLVRNCLRMRPERIIVGEVRGPEAVDLLSAMSTGHDGSMGTVHANTPRDALGRLESMIVSSGVGMPAATVRQQIASAIDVIIHVQRLLDGTRKIVSISEVTGMEGDTITMQDLVTFEYKGEDENGMIQGHFAPTKLKPKFFDKLRQYHLDIKYLEMIEKA